MDFIISFFRDTLSGGLYWLYVFTCIFFIFFFLGMIGSRKQAAIIEKLKAKKADDIASGREAEIAAMESKQRLDVMKDETEEVVLEEPSVDEEIKKENGEEVPQVLVITEETKEAETSN